MPEAVNLPDIVYALGRKNPELTEAVLKRVVRCVLEQMVETLAEGGRVELRRFGVLWVTKRGGVEGRNPSTGEPIKVEPKRAVRWRTGAALARALQPPSA